MAAAGGGDAIESRGLYYQMISGPIKSELKKRIDAERKAIRALILSFVRIVLPLALCVFIFFAVDIHAFDDIALRSSTSAGNTTLSRVFLYLGANVHANSDQPIGLAVMYGDAKLISLLLDHGADIEAQKGFPLNAAINRERLDLVDLLLSHGAEVCGVKGFLSLKAAKTKRNIQIADHILLKMSESGCPDKTLAHDAERLIKADHQ